MNKITIFGRLTEDVKLIKTSSDVSVATFGFASNGRNREDVNYFECKAFRGLADTLAKNKKKGDQLVVYGVMNQYKYQAQDGTARSGWEVLIDDVDFVSGGAKKESAKAEELSEEETGKLPF